MKFSIITPTFNSRATLAAAMTSVLGQAGVELEYLLIDGGSTDGTVELIREFAAADPRVRWISELDEGIADAFNKGLALASGEWIGILNSDDRYLPGALAAVAAVAQADAAAEVIHGDMLRLAADGTPLFVLKPATLATSLWRQMPLNHPATFVARRAYERIGGFDLDLKYAMDYDLVVRLCRAGCSFRYLERELAAMAYGGASDAHFWRGAREVCQVAIRYGAPPAAARRQLLVNGAKGALKQLLRASGLTLLLRLHPRFRKAGSA